MHLIPAVKHSPKRYLWSSYDAEADVLYVNFKKPSHADDSELTDDDVIIRYEQGEASMVYLLIGAMLGFLAAVAILLVPNPA